MSGIPNNRRTQYTKKIIREEFLELLQQKDITKITVTDIADAADINRGTFYKYYKNPYDLLQHIEKEFINEILENIQMDKLPLDVWLETVLTILKKNKHISQLILANTSSKHLLTDLLEIVKPEAFQRFQHYFNQATEEELELYFAYFVSGSVGLIERWLKDFSTMSAQKVSRLLVDVFETNIYE